MLKTATGHRYMSVSDVRGSSNIRHSAASFISQAIACERGHQDAEIRSGRRPVPRTIHAVICEVAEDFRYSAAVVEGRDPDVTAAIVSAVWEVAAHMVAAHNLRNNDVVTPSRELREAPRV